jgi:hypothetical protein
MIGSRIAIEITMSRGLAPSVVLGRSRERLVVMPRSRGDPLVVPRPSGEPDVVLGRSREPAVVPGPSADMSDCSGGLLTSPLFTALGTLWAAEGRSHLPGFSHGHLAAA